MRAIVLTSRGIEPYCIEELKSFGVHASGSKGIIHFEYDDESVLHKIAYLSQTAHRVTKLLVDLQTSNPLRHLEILFKEHTRELEGTLKVESIRSGDHDFNSVDVYAALRKSSDRVSLKKGDNHLLAIIVDDYIAICEDVAKMDLAKRDYKVFSSSFSIKAPVAAALTYAAKWDEESILLDPYCRDGTIAIEAALKLTKMSPRKFEKRKLGFQKAIDLDSLDEEEIIKGNIIASDPMFPNLSSAKKNAKIATLHKTIDFRKYAIDDLDLAIEPESIGAIATSHRNLTRTFFERASEILRPSARVAALLQQKPTEESHKIAQEFGFELVEETEFWLGKRAHPVVIYQLSK